MKGKQRSILNHIQYVVILGLVILIVCMELCSIAAIQKALVRDVKNEVAMEAGNQGRFIDSWLSKKIEETELISKSVEAMGKFTDEDMQEYLIQCASLDSDVLNYYLCRSGIPYVVYNGGIFDLDPTGRSWWAAAWEAEGTIITDAYVDANSGAIVISVATPFYLNGVESVILADITIDTIITTMQDKVDENLSMFLTSKDGTLIVYEDEKYCMQADGSSTNISDIINIDLTSNDVQIVKNENKIKNYYALSTIENTGWRVGACLPKSYMVNRINKAVIFIAIVAIIVCVLGNIYFVYMLRKQLAPMAEMKYFVEEVVVGRENVPNYKDEKDEISFLITELKDRFVETIKKTKNEMQNVDNNIQQTNSSVGQIVDAVSNISSVIEETAASMDTQTNNIASISNDCTIISNASVAVANQAQEMAVKSNEIVTRIEELTPKMKADREASKKSVMVSQNKLMEAIKEAECINEISSVSDAIRRIAAQTNLLSLNASIESARAGEAGRGFAVVADEIRSLSDETNNEINKISDLTNRLFQAVKTLSQESTESMNSLSKDIENAYQTVELLSSEYVESAKYFSSVSEELGANSEELSASVQTVATSVSDISASQNEVNVAMDSASQGIQEVAEDAFSMKSKMETVSTAVEEISQTVQQFNI